MARRSAVLFTTALAAVCLGGCSLRSFAAAKVGDALAEGGASWSTEDDPELVREALPFTLKTMESLAAAAPRHVGLRLGLCRGFSSYAGGFLEPEAEAIETENFVGAQRLRLRARKLHLRAFHYCQEALDLEFAGAGTGLDGAPATIDAALARVSRKGVELLYWSGVSMGSAISLGLDQPEIVAHLPAVRAIFERALVLDESFDRGSLHEAMIVFDSMPATMGGSAARARAHFERAIALSGGLRASPYVTWAMSSTVSRQARREFRETLETALAIDPDLSPPDRLVNLIMQDRARKLLARIDDFFFVDEEESNDPPPAATAGKGASDDPN